MTARTCRPVKSVTKTVRQPWPDARVLVTRRSVLYHLRTELSTGDVLRTRFGFREFWIEGHRYILNGSKVNLLATSWWPPTEPMTREEIRKHWRALEGGRSRLFPHPHATLATRALRRGGRSGTADDHRRRHVARPLLHGLPRSRPIGTTMPR